MENYFHKIYWFETTKKMTREVILVLIKPNPHCPYVQPDIHLDKPYAYLQEIFNENRIQTASVPRTQNHRMCP